MGDHLSRLPVTRQLVQPTRDLRDEPPFPPDEEPDGPCLALLRAGVAWPRALLRDAGGLLHHHFTLTSREAVCFCGPIRRLSAPRELPGALPCGVRTFLDPAKGPRSPDQPGHFHHNIKANGRTTFDQSEIYI